MLAIQIVCIHLDRHNSILDVYRMDLVVGAIKDLS